MKTKNLIQVSLILIAFALVLGGCAHKYGGKISHSEGDHFNVGEPVLNDVDPNAYPKMVIHAYPGNGPVVLNYAMKDIGSSEKPITEESFDNPVILPMDNKRRLDKRAKSHLSRASGGNGKLIYAVIAKYPEKDIPSNHKAFAVQKYLRDKGVDVPIIKRVDPYADLRSVSIKRDK